MANKKVDKKKIGVRIMAGVLAALMVLGFGTTLIWYLING